ncbi:MAG: Major Facilitator Superfamily protein [candidate division TA06 bacterium ADurb.Bin131]|uniref:Major Facilitator Superfamily protein n=1 Tax=candidate division TA06 bacterium ADurb.Bin131 TaxID=1852827 RepID=A0A1V6CA55_UNCT6|nr:MAG: Major Facilitator Superfamily protein [candidate division TA06 bacterium ADurb.Bin131]HQL64544.1 MFS transporter [bacterium]
MLSTREKNIYFISQVSGNTYYTVAFNGVLTLFLLKIGVKEGLLGFLSVIPFIVGIGSFLLVPWVGRNYTRIMRPVSYVLIILAFLLLPLFLISERIGYRASILYYATFVFLFWTGTQISSLAWFPVVHLWVPEDERGRFFGTLRFTSTIVGFGFLRLSSYMLGIDPTYMDFFNVMLVVSIFALIWPVALSKVPMPSPEFEEQEKVNFFSVFRDIFSDRERNIYFWFYFLWNLAAYTVAPFIVPFYKMVLNLPASFCIFVNSISVLGMGGLAFIWGKVNDFRGSRFVLFFSFILASIYYLLMAHIHLFPAEGIKRALIFTSLVGGIAGGGQLMGDTTRRLMIAPEKNRVGFFSYLSVFGGQLPALIVPPITGPFIEAHKNFHIGSYGIYQIFFLSLAVLYLMILGLILKMKPIKEKPVGEIFRDVITENLMKLRDLIASPP